MKYIYGCRLYCYINLHCCCAITINGDLSCHIWSWFYIFDLVTRAIVWCFCFFLNVVKSQGITWERGEAKGWINTEPVLPHRLYLQLLLLHLPRLPFPDVDIRFLDLLGISQFCIGSTARLWTPRSRNRCSGVWLVKHSILPWEPSCQPMVCHCQYRCWFCIGHVCDHPYCLLA